MNIILNLTQHKATPEQIVAGVVDYNNQQELCSLLTFNNIPSKFEMEYIARQLVHLVHDYDEDITHVMIGGAPFFMSILEKTLLQSEITPVYSFSKRESVEIQNEDGSVTKTQVFRHIGFVSVFSE